MKKKLQLSLIIIALFLSLTSANYLYSQEEKPYQLNPVSDDAYQAILQFYQYDKDVPLEAKIISKLEKEDFIREKIVFNGIMNSRVPGYLAIPKNGTAPYPCILQVHGLTLSKSDWWENSYDYGEVLTKKLLSLGYAVLALDMKYHGERIIENDYETFDITLFKKNWLIDFVI